ncbi:MAG: ATP synthase F0 subunit B [Bradymonadales bacterium]|nr:ATP synthase F0 subunit B [Bradymonadales bacterium]
MPTAGSLQWVDSLTLASGSSISVDGSALLLVLLFVGLMIYLNHVLYQPYLRVKSLRQDRIVGVRAEAADTQRRVAELLASYQAGIDQARKQALDQKIAARLSARKSQQEITDQAKAQADDLLQQHRAEVQAALERAESELQAQAERLSSIIVTRVLPS